MYQSCIQFVSNLSVMYKYHASSLYGTYMYLCVLMGSEHLFLNVGMYMESLLDPVIDSSHRSFFAAVEHRALEVLRPRPPGEQISIHHDWVDRYVMKYYCLSLMYLMVFLYFDNFVYCRLRESGLLNLGHLVEGGLVRRSLTDGGRRHTHFTSRVGRWLRRCRTWPTSSASLSSGRL